MVESCSSGCAAADTLLSTLKSGDHVVCGRDVYGGTYRLFTKVFEKFGVQFTFINAHNLSEIGPAIRENTKLLWLESPSNPQLSITDIAEACKVAHARGVKVCVDNTFATPYLQQPLKLGADYVLHSTTKYLGGHSDVVGGAILLNDEEAYSRFKFMQNAVGAVPGGLDCFLLLRGTKTLHVRMERHCENARKIAAFLKGEKEVARVYYPGLSDFPGHAVARKQMRDFGGMVSFELAGSVERGKKFCSLTRVFALAESLGGVESLVGHPVTMTHASIPPAERAKGGLTDNLVRLSVGIEDCDDLIADIQQAIAKSR